MSSIICLAIAIFNESRGEPEKARYAVAEVIINRSNEQNKSICEIIKQPNQFSFVKNKVLKTPKHELNAWEDAKKIASYSLSKRTNYTNGATYFNTKAIGVRFNKKHKVTIGNHVFF